LMAEFENVIDLTLYVFKSLGFEDFVTQVSLRDPENKEKYIGSDENWKKAEDAIVQSAIKKGLNYVVEYGEAAFYGPKLDFMFKDAIGREWQCATVQVDFNLPNRFNLSFVNEQGEMERPVVIHRAISGSLERFMGVMIENFG